MKIKALVVDDELKSAENLIILLKEYCTDIIVVGISQSVDNALELIKKNDPNLVFLDVRMKNETGFDLLKRCEKITFDVVFTTAYSEYAIKAFKFSAIDYLLKPIDIEELQNAVEKAREKANTGVFSEERIEAFLSNIKSKPSGDSKLALPDTKGLTFVKLSDILYCEGQNNYTVFHTMGGRKYTVAKTLKDYENMLSEYNFFRIHKSYLINLNEIKEYVRGDGGYVIMNNDTTLDVSKRKKEPFLSRIAEL